MTGNSNFGFSGGGSGGGGGTITGGGTLNYIAIFTPSGTAIGDSLMSQVSNPDDATVTSVQIAADLIPDNTLNSRKLGASTRRWDTLYMASNIDYSSDLLFNSGGNQYFRMSTSGDFFVADNKNIDVENTGSKILNIGLQNATVINIGTGLTPKTINVGSATTLLDNINIYGNMFSQEVTNLLVKDKLFTVNDGGAVASGFNAGFQIDEGGVNTGWFITNSTRNGWEFKAPSITGIATLDLSVITADRTYTLPDSTGTFALESYVVANFLPLTLTGATTVNLGVNNLTFDGGANTARLILSATNATDPKIFSFRTNNVSRWAFRVDGIGDDFAIRRYDNAGVFVDAPISIDRANGDVVIDNVLYAPSITGGTAVGSGITYKGTTGVGASTVSAHTFTVGNNGATTAAQIFNSGQVSIGNYASPTNLRMFTVGQDTAYMSFGSMVGTPSSAAIYLNAANPSPSNWSIASDGDNIYMNTQSTTGYLYFSNSGNVRFYVGRSTIGTALAPDVSGATTTFTFTKPNNTGQSAGVAINGVLWTLGSRTWANGGVATTIASQKEFELTTPTYLTSGGGSLNFTTAYTFYVNEPTLSGTTATAKYAIGGNGSFLFSDGTRSLKYTLAASSTLVQTGDTSSSINVTSGTRSMSMVNFSGDLNYIGSVGASLVFGTSDSNVLRIQTNDVDRLTIGTSGSLTFADANNIVFNATTGTKIGTATTQKLAFWNATPIVQPTTAVAAATLVGGGGTTLTDTDTFDGYTLKQIVKALRNTGLLA